MLGGAADGGSRRVDRPRRADRRARHRDRGGRADAAGVARVALRQPAPLLRARRRALAWMAEHHVGAHHLAFDTLITGGWSRLEHRTHRRGDGARRAGVGRRRDVRLPVEPAAGRLPRRAPRPRHGRSRRGPCGSSTRSREAVDFDRCRPYTDRLVGVEVEALAGSGRPLEAARMIETLEPGPRRRLLMARFHGAAGSRRRCPAGRPRVVAGARAAAGRARAVRPPARCRHRPDALVDLVAECGETGWVVPFLGFGPRVERLLRSMPLDELHPRLASTLAFIAPRSPACAGPAPRACGSRAGS